MVQLLESIYCGKLVIGNISVRSGMPMEIAKAIVVKQNLSGKHKSDLVNPSLYYGEFKQVKI